MEYFFKTKQLDVGYNKKPLITDITISIKKGEILTLIGPNGAGKSTVLKSIAKQLEKINGTIYINNEEIETIKSSELAKKMAIVLTDKMKTELMTCEEVVASGRYPYTGRFGRLSEADRLVVEEAMQLVQVSEFRDKDFTQISDGQRQRIMLARAICQEPEIVILDEPTSFLDIKYKLEFLSILQRMKRKKGLTVIMSLHELELAERISDKILCIDGKCVDRYGTPDQIFTLGYIKKLFHINVGSYDEMNGNMELEPCSSPPNIFVIAGGGTGRELFRRLQREGKSFITGIIYENDLDFPVASVLASKVVTASAFEPVQEQEVAIAKGYINACKEVICCKQSFGTLELANRELYEYAKALGKIKD